METKYYSISQFQFDGTEYQGYLEEEREEHLDKFSFPGNKTTSRIIKGILKNENEAVKIPTLVLGTCTKLTINLECLHFASFSTDINEVPRQYTLISNAGSSFSGVFSPFTSANPKTFVGLKEFRQITNAEEKENAKKFLEEGYEKTKKLPPKAERARNTTLELIEKIREQ